MKERQRRLQIILISILMGICIFGIGVSAVPLTPEGGTGYTVSGSIEGGDICYTLIDNGNYELTHDINTLDKGIILNPSTTSRLFNVNGMGYSITQPTKNTIYYKNDNFVQNLNTTINLNNFSEISSGSFVGTSIKHQITAGGLYNYYAEFFKMEISNINKFGNFYLKSGSCQYGQVIQSGQFYYSTNFPANYNVKFTNVNEINTLEVNTGNLPRTDVTSNTGKIYYFVANTAYDQTLNIINSTINTISINKDTYTMGEIYAREGGQGNPNVRTISDQHNDNLILNNVSINSLNYYQQGGLVGWVFSVSYGKAQRNLILSQYNDCIINDFTLNLYYVVGQVMSGGVKQIGNYGSIELQNWNTNHVVNIRCHPMIFQDGKSFEVKLMNSTSFNLIKEIGNLNQIISYNSNSLQKVQVVTYNLHQCLKHLCF